MATVAAWIDGQAVESSTTYEVKHPKSGKVGSTVHASSASDVDRAIAGAHAAFRTWSEMPAHKRRDILISAAKLLESREQEYQEAYSRDTAVSGVVMMVDRGNSVAHLMAAATLCTEIKGEIPPTHDGSLALVTREPFGVCFGISPFNFGAVLAVRCFAYALACGNTFIFKACPTIPSLHLFLVKLMHEAGLPSGCLQLLHFAPGTEGELTEQVISNSKVGHVNFTGSTNVGRIIGTLCAKYIKPVLLELGGNAPAVVLPDADLKAAANSFIIHGMMHSGQICMSTARLIVVESVADALVEELTVIAKGDLESLGRMALASRIGLDKMHTLVKDAISKGAKPIVPTETPDDDELSYRPVILDNVDDTQDIYHKETFGPALVIIRARDTEHAIELANDSDVGLSASVWSRDIGEALRVAKRIQSGAVHINSGTVHDEPGLPHGGYKNSGIGRFNGQQAANVFTQYKCITLRGPVMLPIQAIA